MWLLWVVACLTLQAANTEEMRRTRHQNPQEFMNITEIIHYWGYPNERYEVLTADGYYLLLNRIPYGVHCSRKTGPRPAVLVVPGFGVESRTWIANLPNNSLGFFLADAGYDVWLLNCRGSTWSKRHHYLSIDQEEFWDFSFHEMGMYDIPATIDFILNKTKQDALYFVAHSQGVAAGFIAFSDLPQVAQKVKLFFGLSPPYTLVGMKGLAEMILSLPEDLGKAVWGTKELILLSKRMKSINTKLCSYAGLDQLCAQLSYTITGFNQKNLNLSRADVYTAIVPDSTSVKTGIHWRQVFKSNQFKHFDYGSKNKDVYNTTTPPFYKIENMFVPIAVWYGGNDFIASKKDVELLLSHIPRLVFKKCVPTWNHADSVVGLDIPEHLFRDMLFLMQQYK